MGQVPLNAVIPFLFMMHFAFLYNYYPTHILWGTKPSFDQTAKKLLAASFDWNCMNGSDHSTLYLKTLGKQLS